ncbi:MAG: hypothetical protein R3C45_02005 [Phycisphaerales bacterium]
MDHVVRLAQVFDAAVLCLFVQLLAAQASATEGRGRAILRLIDLRAWRSPAYYGTGPVAGRSGRSMMRSVSGTP